MKALVAVRVATALVVVVGSAGQAILSAGPASSSATVEFLDGKTLNVDEPRFVYLWVRRSHRQFINPPKHRIESSDFHYTTVERGVAIDQVLPSRKLKRIDPKWVPASPEQADLVALTITTEEGRSFEIPASLFGDRT